ncbi:MAG: damage-control phosphatase ARMT1 family protein [Caldilineaceae bacterium]
MTQAHPRLPLPPPLDGCQPGTFTHYTITTRWPAIVQNVVRDNAWPAVVVAQLAALRADLPDGIIRPLAPSAAPDSAAWQTYVQPYLGQRWLEAPWFFGETYFYRRLLEATGYFEGGAGAGVDPFARQKQQGLVNSLAATRTLCAQLAALHQAEQQDDALLRHLLTVALWGNQADLSLSPTVAGAPNPADPSVHRAGEPTAAETHILVNDTGAVIAYLADVDPQAVRIDIILDNAGFELVSDLCLADFLVRRGRAATVVLHGKAHPTFVSDATVADVHATLLVLANDVDPTVQALASRLQEYLQQGQLQLQDDLFWTSPLSLWATPPHLVEELSQARLLISKGDANYRRLLGDRHWPFTTPFAEVVCYTPAPLLALRTLKSEIIVGLRPEQPATLGALEPAWLTNGRWGIIQCTEATHGTTAKDSAGG